MALSPEYDGPAVMGDPVDDGSRHLAVREDGSPPGEVDVGGDCQAAPLAARIDRLEERPRAAPVHGDVAELIDGQQASPVKRPRRPLERALALGLRELGGELGGGEAPRPHAHRAGGGTGCHEHAGLARAHGAAGGQVPRLADERAGDDALPRQRRRRPRRGPVVPLV